MVTYLIPTSQAEHIGKKLINEPDISVIFPDKNKDGKRYFPDGEVYERISRVKSLDNKVIFLHSGAPDTNTGLIELEQLLQIANHENSERKKSERFPIEVFFTLFPYGRQDNRFQVGETNAAEEYVKKLTNYYNVGRIYTIDAHFAGKRDWVKDYPIFDVSAVDLLKQVASKFYSDILYLAPDKGSQLRLGLKGTEKSRTDSYSVEIESNEEFAKMVKHRIVGVIDDILLTGGTLSKFYDECMKLEAKGVIALVTHATVPEGISRIKAKYSKLFFTNSVNNENANVNITGLVLDTIREYQPIRM
jgi:phosphoribosylpyrophosphate synthetase